MKMGFRTTSPKRSFSARTTGKLKRTIKKATNPLYGKKGMGYINNPKKAIYNKVYNKTTVGVNQVFSGKSSVSRTTFDSQTALNRINQLNETAKIINTTTNVSTFFSRFNFALQICDELVQYEYTGIIQTITPTQQKREFLEQIPDVINSLIVRSYNKEYAKAQELKTEKGRHNRLIRFFNTLVEELNQYGAKYITETNISKIHELACSIGIDDEITVNLVPTTISLPVVNTAPTTSISHSSHVKSDTKMICPKCKDIFINHSTCPTCGRTLIPASDYTNKYVDDQFNKTAGSVAGCAIGVYCCPLLFVGIIFLILEMYSIALVIFAVYALIIFIAYSVGKK